MSTFKFIYLKPNCSILSALDIFQPDFYNFPDCLLQKEAGPCISGITRYYYDIKTIKCRPFVYGGCQGNANNYLTREQCQEKCKLRQGKT